MGLFSFFHNASDYVTPEHAALEQSGEFRETHASYHRRIVQVSCIFGVLGAMAGIALSISTALNEENARGVLLGPFLFGAAGLLFGVAVACLFAPRKFLTGPMGDKWMKLIGTKNVLAARIVCLIFGLIIVAPLVGFGLLFMFAD